MDFATPLQVKVSGVRTVETHWIPLGDGRRLAARLFLPADAEANPVPAILEYIPYRRRDGTRTGDDQMHLWFAAHGFAAVRVLRDRKACTISVGKWTRLRTGGSVTAI